MIEALIFIAIAAALTRCGFLVCRARRTDWWSESRVGNYLEEDDTDGL